MAARYLSGLTDVLGISIFNSNSFTFFLEKLHKGVIHHAFGYETSYFALVDREGMDMLVVSILNCFRAKSLHVVFLSHHAHIEPCLNTLVKLIRVLRVYVLTGNIDQQSDFP